MLAAMLLLGTSCSYLTGVQKDKTVEINLGGVRQAKAFLTTSKDDYLIRVVMVPIRDFDKTTNDLLNFENARELAFLALAKHLSAKETVELTVSGAETEKSGVDGKVYSLILRVPINGVTLAKATENKGKEPAKGTERIIFNSNSPLFTRKSDYETIINRLETILVAELAKVKDEKEEDKFDEAVAKIKKQGVDNLEKIERAIKTDLLLYSMEQAELREAVARVKSLFLGKVEEANKQYKKKIQDKEKEKKRAKEKGRACLSVDINQLSLSL